MSGRTASGLPDSPRLLLEHYRALLERYGPDHRAVQWSSHDAQRRRFMVLADAVERDERVVDLGCGLGDLAAYLRQERGFEGTYVGVDQVPEFIAHAERRYAADADTVFECADVSRYGFEPAPDCVLASGLFNNRLQGDSANLDWLRATVSRAFQSVRRVVAFNALSTWVPRTESSLAYFDPAEITAWCARRLTENLVLRHDYNAPPSLGVPRDFTLYLYR